MKKIPEEKEFSKAELQKNIDRVRRMMPLLSKASRPPKVVYGKERYLDTAEGKIRVLMNNTESPGKLPLFVNIHGGGFTSGSPELDDRFMNDVAKRANVKVLNVDYSLSPEEQFPKALNECYAVVEYAKRHAEELGIDPDRIAVGGHSAGGNFGAAICLKDAGSHALNIKGLILDYPPLDIYTDAYLKPQPKGSIPPKMCRIADASYCLKKEERKNPLISPVYATVDQVKAFPATLVITASGDILCDEAERFKDKLIEAGVDVTFKRFDAKHGFTHYGGPLADEAWQMMIDHLKRCLWH
jgi:acetyl esterase/lipase